MVEGSEHAPARRLPLAFLAYLSFLLLAVALTLPAGLSEAASRPFEVLIWSLFIAVSNLVSLPALPRGLLDVSLGGPLTVATAVLLPPPLAVLVNSLALTNEREFKRSAKLEMSLFNRAQIGLTAGVASLVAHTQPWGIVAGTALAVLTYIVVNTGFIALVLVTKSGLGVREATKESASPFPRFTMDFGVLTLLALFIVIAYEQIGVWAPVLLTLPLWLGFSAMRSAREAEDRSEELAKRVRELETLNAAGTELLRVRHAPEAAEISRHALAEALETESAVVALDGKVPAGLVAVPVPGAEPVVLGIPEKMSAPPPPVVETIAGLLGMTLVRQELERELAEVERARAKLSGQILEEGTRERSRMALELHDDVLPTMAAAQIQSDNIRSALSAGALDRADALAAATRDQAHAAVAQLRQVLDDMRRQIIVPGGLRQGLVEALDELKLKHGIEGKLQAADPLPEMPFAVEILLLDTVRGTLANVMNHAEAGAVEVELEVKERTARLVVRDDGRGFDPRTVPQGHHGLGLMAQRVELARGRFLLDSTIGEGTQVQVEVPV